MKVQTEVNAHQDADRYTGIEISAYQDSDTDSYNWVSLAVVKSCFYMTLNTNTANNKLNFFWDKYLILSTTNRQTSKLNGKQTHKTQTENVGEKKIDTTITAPVSIHNVKLAHTGQETENADKGEKRAKKRKKNQRKKHTTTKCNQQSEAVQSISISVLESCISVVGVWVQESVKLGVFVWRNIDPPGPAALPPPTSWTRPVHISVDLVVRHYRSKKQNGRPGSSS